MKNILKVIGVGIIGLTLAACGLDGNEATGVADDGQVNIGILQFMEHNSLQAARDGFVAELEESDLDIVIEDMNSQGDQSNLQSMSEKIANNNDLILSIATPAAQSLATVEQDKPILFTAVTDPADAGLVERNEAPGMNLTGTSDMVPIEEQITLLLSIVPDAETIGIAYNSSEPNSEIQAKMAIKELEAAGVNVEVATVTTTNDVQQVISSLAQDVDGLYLPTDNTIASTMAIIGEIAADQQLPVVAGATAMVEDGGLATYGINYEDLGRQTARMALRILQDGTDPSEIAVETSDNLELVVNEEMAEALGINPASISVD